MCRCRARRSLKFKSVFREKGIEWKPQKGLGSNQTTSPSHSTTESDLPVVQFGRGIFTWWRTEHRSDVNCSRWELVVGRLRNLSITLNNLSLSVIFASYWKYAVHDATQIPAFFFFKFSYSCLENTNSTHAALIQCPPWTHINPNESEVSVRKHIGYKSGLVFHLSFTLDAN